MVRTQADKATQQVQEVHAKQLNDQLMTNEPTTQSLVIDLGHFYEDPAYQGETLTANFPLMMASNTKEAPSHGYLIKGDEMAKAGWHGPEPNHEHRFGGASAPTNCLLLHGYKTSKQDYSVQYPAPRMNIIHVSDIYMEITGQDDDLPPMIDGKPLMNPQTGKPVESGDAVGILDPNTDNNLLFSLLYNQPKGHLKVTKRQFYYVYLLDEKNEPYHNFPFRLSIAGGARGSLEYSYNVWKREFATAFAAATGRPPKYDWAQSFYALGVFEPTLWPDYAGKAGSQSLVTKVQDFVHPTKDNFTSLFLGADSERVNMIAASASLAESSTERFLVENEYHGLVLEAGAEALAALPAAQSTTQPVSINPDVDEDGLPIAKGLKSAAVVD
jgi:hypothetical protein